MIGTGMNPEGIHENEIMFEFMNENTWRQEPRNLTEWYYYLYSYNISSYSKKYYSGTHRHCKRLIIISTDAVLCLYSPLEIAIRISNIKW